MTAWLAVDGNGDEYIYAKRPFRTPSNGKFWDIYWDNPNEDKAFSALTKGTIKQLTGKDLTWEDEAYEL